MGFLSKQGCGNSNALIDAEMYQMLVTGDVSGFNRVMSSRQVDVLELRCAWSKNTVLHITSSSGKLELVDDILIKWPELMVQGNSQGDLPIHSALKTGEINIVVVDALMSWLQHQQAIGNNIVVHQVLEWNNVEGSTALHTALEEVYDLEKQIKLARTLVDLYPPAAYAMNNEGICPLYVAIKEELADLVQHMLQKLQPFKEDALGFLTKGQSVLHAAVSAQRTDMLELLLLFDDGKLINLMNEEGLTALSFATYKGYLDKVQVFDMKAPDSAFICNKNKSFPIHQAVLGGHKSIIGLLSSSRFLLNARGENILHLAISTGDSKLVSHVLRLSDVDSLINQNDDDGNTPLHLATLAKHVEVVEILIQHEGVNVGLSNKEGLMANDLAKKLEFVDDTDRNLVKRLNLILEKATNYIKLFPIDGNLYLHLVNREINRVAEIVSERGLQLKDLLTPEEGNNVLHIAACMDSTHLIHDLLVGHNCTTLMYQANKKGDLPIHSAVKAGKLQCLEGLFLWSTIPSDRICKRPNMDGNTALHLALLCNHRKIANYLYKQCPEAAYCLNKDNVCPLFLAIKNWSKSENNLITSMIQGFEGNAQLQNHLKGAESVVHVAITVKNEGVLKSIIETAPSLLDSLDRDGLSPLSYAALRGHVKGVKLLLEKYPDLEFKRDKDKDGSFPIHQAAKGGYRKVVKLLRLMPLLNNKGQNILHVAAANDKLDFHFITPIMRMYEELINTADDNGNTPLHLAVKGFHLDAVYRLLYYQHINSNLKNKELQTPLDIFITLLKYPDEKGLSSLQIYLMDLMLSTTITKTLFPSSRQDSPEVKEKLKELKVAKLYASSNKGPSSKGTTSKESANVLLVVATLIITVTFAAGFSPPGGYSEQTGKPNLLAHELFRSFVSYNCSALVVGIASALVLILGMNIKGFVPMSLYWGGLYILFGLFFMVNSFSNVLLLYYDAKKELLTTNDASKSIKESMDNGRHLVFYVLIALATPILMWGCSKFKETKQCTKMADSIPSTSDYIELCIYFAYANLTKTEGSNYIPWC